MKKNYPAKILVTMVAGFLMHFPAKAQNKVDIEAKASVERAKILLKGPSYDKDKAYALTDINMELQFLKGQLDKDRLRKKKKDSKKMEHGIDLRNNNRSGGPTPPDITDFNIPDTMNVEHAKLTNGLLQFGGGLELVGKGGIDNFTDFQGQVSKTTTVIYYLQILALVRYSWFLQEGGALSLTAGPYYGYALFGNEKGDGTKTKLTFGKNKDFTRGDFGGRVVLGYHLSNSPIDIGIFTEIGFRNIIPAIPGQSGSDIDKNKNQTFGIQVGYTFK